MIPVKKESQTQAQNQDDQVTNVADMLRNEAHAHTSAEEIKVTKTLVDAANAAGKVAEAYMQEHDFFRAFKWYKKEAEIELLLGKPDEALTAFDNAGKALKGIGVNPQIADAWTSMTYKDAIDQWGRIDGLADPRV